MWNLNVNLNHFSVIDKLHKSQGIFIPASFERFINGAFIDLANDFDNLGFGSIRVFDQFGGPGRT